MSTETTIVGLLLGAINVLAIVIIANHKGLWVSGREYREKCEISDKWEALALRSLRVTDTAVTTAQTTILAAKESAP